MKQLKTQLKAMIKEEPTCQYLLKIKKIVDSMELDVAGSPISTEHHIEMILDGLNEEYSAFITVVLFRSDPYSFVDEIEVY